MKILIKSLHFRPKRKFFFGLVKKNFWILLTALGNLTMCYSQIVFDNNSPIYYAPKDTILYETKTIFSGNIMASTGKIDYWDNEKTAMVTGVKKTLVLLINTSLKHNCYFFWMFNIQLNKEVYKHVTWLPDYSFMLYRDKYMPNTLAWGYGNFGINRFSNSLKQIGESLSAGNFYLCYRAPIPQKILKCIKIHTSTNLTLSTQLNYAIKYYDLNGHFTGSLFNGKPSLGLNIQYNIYKGFFLSGSTAYSLKKDAQSPWGSDYSYGLGYANGKPWHLSILYANALNKYPWSKHKIKSGLQYGDLGLAFNYTIQYKKIHNPKKEEK